MYLLSGCNDISCGLHERCVEPGFGQNARCMCKRGFRRRRGRCRTLPICFTVQIRLTIPFNILFLNIFSDYTITFIGTFESRFFLALRLTPSDFVSVFSISQGSTVVAVDVLLQANTTQNATSLRDNLVSDIYQNSTEQLFPYFLIPPSSDQNNVILELNRNSYYIV